MFLMLSVILYIFIFCFRWWHTFTYFLNLIFKLLWLCNYDSQNMILNILFFPPTYIDWNFSIKNFPSTSIVLSWKPLYTGKIGWMLDLCSLFTNFQNNDPVLWKITTMRNFFKLFHFVFINIMNVHMFHGWVQEIVFKIPHYNFTLIIYSLHFHQRHLCKTQIISCPSVT